MTATPIPRTLVLSVYGDLEVSVLDELPPGRKPVETLFADREGEEALLDLIRKRIRLGQQVYWVCLLIEEEGDPRAVVSRFDQLSKRLPEVRVGMLHGRLPLEEKERGMKSFFDGETDLHSYSCDDDRI